VDEKFRSRRWILANSILNWSRLFAAVILLLGSTLARENLESVIIGVLTFLGTAHALVYGAYAANRAMTDIAKEDNK